MEGTAYLDRSHQEKDGGEQQRKGKEGKGRGSAFYLGHDKNLMHTGGSVSRQMKAGEGRRSERWECVAVAMATDTQVPVA